MRRGAISMIESQQDIQTYPNNEKYQDVDLLNTNLEQMEKERGTE